MSNSAVQEELAIILASRCFRSRKILQKLLNYLVTQKLAKSSEKLTQHTIARVCLGKDKDFDSLTNPIVRIQVGRLRKQLEEYYATEGRFNALRISFPMGSYIPLITSSIESTAPLNLPSEQKFSISQGPNIVCIPRNFTQDDDNNWLFICSFTRDYVTTLNHFIYCQVIFADETPWQKKEYLTLNWLQYDADFALFFDLYYQQQGYELKCTLVSRLNQQIIWTHNFSLSEQYPEKIVSRQIFKRIAHDTVSVEKGLAINYWVRQLLDTGKPIAAHQQITVAVRQYCWDISYNTFLNAFNVCEKRLAEYPHDTIALIVLADACRGEYLLRFNIIENLKERIAIISNKLLELAPENAYSHLFYAMSCLLEERYLDCESAIENAQMINSLDTHLNNLTGLLYIGLDQWEKGSKFIEDSIAVSPVYPDWYHLALSVYHYREGHYLAAMQEVQRIRFKHLWTPILRAALYQQGGWREKGKKEHQQLEHEYPDFKNAGYHLLHGFNMKAGNVVQQLWNSTFGKQSDD